MALTVYLDTQDYINIFNEPEGGENRLVLERLIQQRDQGKIVIGFSFATILELITRPNSENRSERVRRGELIKDICGPNSFPYPTDLAKGATFPNGGRWMFPKDSNVISARSFRKEMHTALQAEVANAEGLNRALRRALSRKSSMQDLIRRSGSTWGRKRSDYGKMPVSDEMIQSRIMERFMKGQCSDAEFEARLGAWLSDPAEYSRIIYDYADKPNIIEEFFGKPTSQIEDAVAKVQGVIADVKRHNDEILKARQNLRDLGMDNRTARNLTKQVELPEADFQGITEKLEAVFGKGRAGHFVHYMRHAMVPDYRFKRSDVMDLIQMCYAYDCDLYRCDKAMGNMFRDFEPFEGKLVSRFGDLPDRVEELVTGAGDLPVAN